ncbi:MAG: hypothetical protein F6K40_20865 [Okeania sp. SIO3I5]|uniref:hypothetical protein n=1 Tax=Okeania sp. SIO3I5 TaxID=2607805 RepID=UPI0013B78153|nr:hypothetical protein [Okeania sp. SIO3I5]NEQ38585.1 hypothetical protein [Okeania sp. SIO3I5]
MAGFNQLSVISYQLSVISYQLSVSLWNREARYPPEVHLTVERWLLNLTAQAFLVFLLLGFASDLDGVASVPGRWTGYAFSLSLIFLSTT